MSRVNWLQTDDGYVDTLKSVCIAHGISYGAIRKWIKRYHGSMREISDETLSRRLGFNVRKCGAPPDASDKIYGRNRSNRGYKGSPMVSRIDMMTKPLTRSGGVHRPYY